MDNANCNTSNNSNFEIFISNLYRPRYFQYFHSVIDCTTLAIGLPVVLLAIYVMYHELKNNQPVHVFLINLLISDIIQFIARIIKLIGKQKYKFWFLFCVGIIASVVFMVSIAVERYLLLAHPHWYRFHSNKKCSVITSLVLWTPLLVLICFLILGFNNLLYVVSSVYVMFSILMISFSLLLLFFLLTWRRLFKSRLAAKEKRRIMITIGLVNGNFIFCFFPLILVMFCYFALGPVTDYIIQFTVTFWYFNPLVDTLIFVFTRKSFKVILTDFHCCQTCRHHEDTNSTFSVSADVTSSLSTV